MRVPDGSPAVSHYRALEPVTASPLVALLPETGRTHQRGWSYMASIGCPLAGDWLYGTEDPIIARPALHSHRLTLIHPITGAYPKPDSSSAGGPHPVVSRPCVAAGGEAPLLTLSPLELPWCSFAG